VTVSDEPHADGHEVDRGASPAAHLIEQLATRLGAKASVSAVYGEPIERDGVTVIPVARVSVGFGAGAGRGLRGPQTGEGGGGGGGATAVPFGYIEINEGTVVFKRILHPIFDVAVPVAIAMLGVAAKPLLRSLASSRRHS
jgi:uncharacterized spore protein YtfJ